jgi:ankyrin repeat protein
LLIKGFLSLFLCAGKGHREVLKILLERDPDSINEVDRESNTALHIVAHVNYIVIKYLVEANHNRLPAKIIRSSNKGKYLLLN